MSFYIIIRGPLGCGKSTISEKLSKILNAEYFAVDRVLDEYDLTKDKEDGYISQKSFIKANEIITQRAEKILANNRSVIFDGNFYWKSQVDDLIKRLGFPHYVFTLKAPLEICIERDSKRDKIHGSDAAEAVYKKSTEFDYGIVVDISKSLDEAARKIISHLPKSD
ncbi:MAG: ATP-binding protein [Patescibacteria group bacterium]|jgi:tRNA uridine 5-carbamoylmethylation protein Kti12